MAARSATDIRRGAAHVQAPGPTRTDDIPGAGVINLMVRAAPNGASTRPSVAPNRNVASDPIGDLDLGDSAGHSHGLPRLK